MSRLVGGFSHLSFDSQQYLHLLLLFKLWFVPVNHLGYPSIVRIRVVFFKVVLLASCGGMSCRVVWTIFVSSQPAFPVAVVIGTVGFQVQGVPVPGCGCVTTFRILVIWERPVVNVYYLLYRFICGNFSNVIVTICGVSLWLHHKPYAHLPHVQHCKSFDPRDRRSFSPGWAEGGQVENLGFRSQPSRGHSPLFIIDLRSAMERRTGTWVLYYLLGVVARPTC